MPVPALLWSVLSKHGLWYPLNLLAGMIVPHAGTLTIGDLEQFNLQWLLAGIAVHVGLSLGFGLLYGLLLDKLPPISGAFVWGGLVMPLLWTATSYGLMGVVNPVLQERVDWPWFVASQFVFGLVAALVVDRSEQVHIPPAGGRRLAECSWSRSSSQLPARRPAAIASRSAVPIRPRVPRLGPQPKASMASMPGIAPRATAPPASSVPRRRWPIRSFWRSFPTRSCSPSSRTVGAARRCPRFPPHSAVH